MMPHEMSKKRDERQLLLNEYVRKYFEQHKGGRALTISNWIREVYEYPCEPFYLGYILNSLHRQGVIFRSPGKRAAWKTYPVTVADPKL